ncbi:MAG: phosphoribosylanthranilate isomerase [Chlorobiaceae bacterium]
MTRIKICGITRLQDALDACHAGADALGFNFSGRSPRRVTPETAKAIAKKLPPFVTLTGIFVEHSMEEVNSICRFCGLQAAQLHSEEYGPEAARSICEASVIKVFRPEPDFRTQEVREFAEQSGVTAFLFDAYRPDVKGGTGESIEAALAERIFRELGSSFHTILAGGLNPQNVAEAVRRVRPYAVDTASGVEIEPGIKDPEKIKAFIKAVGSAG